MSNQNLKFKIQNSNNEGQLLLEILISIGVAAIVITLGAQLVFVSLRSSQSAGDKGAALGLLSETHEAVRNAASEDWQNIYGLTKGSTAYYPQQSGGKWIIIAGTESVVIGNISYSRSFSVQNVCRASAVTDGARAITGITDTDGAEATCVTSGGTQDPSTEKIIVTISWSGSETSLSSGGYVTRWGNKICSQSDWSGGTSTATSTCPTTNYETSTSISATTSIELLP